MRAVNLLPPEERGAAGSAPDRGSPATASGGHGALAVLGALALCVVALAGWVLTGNTLKERRVELADVTARAETASAQATKLKPYADFAALATQRVATVRNLADSRFDWEQALRDLSRALPADVTLITLDGDLGGKNAGAGSGGESSALRDVILAPALQLKGCAPGQRDVAVMMSQLRDVDGVTRVTLSKSDKGDTQAPTGTAAGTPAGTDGAVTATDSEKDPCGPDSPPEFTVIVFFERDAAASAEPSLQPTPAGGSNVNAGGAASGSGSGSKPSAVQPADATGTSSFQGGVAP